MRLLLLTTAFTLIGGSVAVADEASDWISSSHEAVFDGEQMVICATPDGPVDGVFNVRGTGAGIQAGQGDGEPVYGLDGVFASSDGTPTAVGVPTTSDRPAAEYTSIEVESERFDGRRTQAFNVFREDLLRATLVFDVGTGAMLSMSSFNADGSEYCAVRTTSFSQPLGLVDAVPAVEVVDELVPVEPDRQTTPATLAGFERLDSYQWRDSGTATYYSDGFFSFTLVSANWEFALDDTDARDVDLPGGVYQRLFEPGRATYVWATEIGGISLVGDLPIDLQEAVLAELAPSVRPNVFTRFWRRFFH